VTRSRDALAAACATALDHGLDRCVDLPVRDLAWLLWSPSLLRGAASVPLASLFGDLDELSRAASWLAELDAAPGPLHHALALKPQTRVGLYAEQLLAFYLAHGPGPRLAMANRPVRIDGRTLGECDFLLTACDGMPLHWELAVKCYLHADAPGCGPLARYVGPNLADRFDLKLARMLTHQLPLGAHPQIAALSPAGPWQSSLCVRGWLFYRWRGLVNRAEKSAENGATNGTSGTSGGAKAAVPNDASPLAGEHLRGWWTTTAEWPACAAALRADGARGESPVDMRWTVLPRLRWMAPLRLPVDHGCAPTPIPTPGIAISPPGIAMSPPGTAIPPPGVHWPARSLALLDDEALLAVAMQHRARRDEPLLVAAMVRLPLGWREASRGFIVQDDWPARAASYAGGDTVT
jgi:hypothetical protein